MDIDLKKFCGDFSHYNCAEPFVKNRWRYATNGQLIIRVPAMGEPDTVVDVFAKLPLPNAEGLFRDHFRTDGCGMPWSVGGLVKEKKTCAECNGTGDVGCKYCRPHECPSCHGNGTIEEIVGRHISQFLIAAKHDELIVNNLIDVFCWTRDGNANPIPLRFAGGEGLVTGRNIGWHRERL